QSVRAMMPKRMFGVSGASDAEAPPTQPAGVPAKSAAAVDVPVLTKVRREILFISFLRQKHVRRHHERTAVGLSRCRFFENRTSEQMGIASRQQQLRKEWPRDLHIDFLSHMGVGRSRWNTRQQHPPPPRNEVRHAPGGGSTSDS